MSKKINKKIKIKIKIKIIDKNGIKRNVIINKKNKSNYIRKKSIYVKLNKEQIKAIKKSKKLRAKVKKYKKSKEYKKEKYIESNEGYLSDLFIFTCKVSDIKTSHCYGIRHELSDNVQDFHNNDYPDHEVKKVEFYKSRFVLNK